MFDKGPTMAAVHGLRDHWWRLVWSGRNTCGADNLRRDSSHVWPFTLLNNNVGALRRRDVWPRFHCLSKSISALRNQFLSAHGLPKLAINQILHFQWTDQRRLKLGVRSWDAIAWASNIRTQQQYLERLQHSKSTLQSTQRSAFCMTTPYLV